MANFPNRILSDEWLKQTLSCGIQDIEWMAREIICARKIVDEAERLCDSSEEGDLSEGGKLSDLGGLLVAYEDETSI